MIDLIRITNVFSALILCLNLIGCDQPQTSKSSDQLINELKSLNNLLLLQDITQINTTWPFSNGYLEQKNTLLLALIVSTEDQALLNRSVELQIIEQRYTERFFPWPYNANPLANYLKKTKDINLFEIKVFLEQVRLAMQIAEKDQIRLNKIELTMLRKQVAIAKSMIIDSNTLQAITKFETYLFRYIPRRSLGLGTLPNGKEWYQARLNYFLGKALPPNKILSRLISIQSELNINQQFVKCFMTEQCKNELGVDWRSKYSNRVLEYNKIEFGFEQAIIAEVDIGVHSQAWSQEHALTVLKNKLNIKSSEAEQILRKIVFEPALSLVNLPIN